MIEYLSRVRQTGCNRIAFLAGFLLFYFVYDLDYTIVRFIATALRPDLAPFIWDETEAQYWSQTPTGYWWLDEASKANFTPWWNW